MPRLPVAPVTRSLQFPKHAKQPAYVFDDRQAKVKPESVFAPYRPDRPVVGLLAADAGVMDPVSVEGPRHVMSACPRCLRTTFNQRSSILITPKGLVEPGKAACPQQRGEIDVIAFPQPCRLEGSGFPDPLRLRMPGAIPFREVDAIAIHEIQTRPRRRVERIQEFGRPCSCPRRRDHPFRPRPEQNRNYGTCWRSGNRHGGIPRPGTAGRRPRSRRYWHRPPPERTPVSMPALQSNAGIAAGIGRSYDR